MNPKTHYYWLNRMSAAEARDEPVAALEDPVLRFLRQAAPENKSDAEKLALLAGAAREAVFAEPGSEDELEALGQLGYIMATVVDSGTNWETKDWRTPRPGLWTRLRAALALVRG